MQAYREAFCPSEQFPAPHAILGVSVTCAPTDEEAMELESTMELAWLRISRGEFLPLPSPEEARAYPWTDAERESLRRSRGPSVVGNPQRVCARLHELCEQTGADELMVVTNIWCHELRLRSYQLLASAWASS